MTACREALLEPIVASAISCNGQLHRSSLRKVQGSLGLPLPGCPWS